MNFNTSEVDFFIKKSGLVFNGVNIDNRQSAISLFAGYQITATFAIEAGYVDLGER